MENKYIYFIIILIIFLLKKKESFSAVSKENDLNKLEMETIKLEKKIRNLPIIIDNDSKFYIEDKIHNEMKTLYNLDLKDMKTLSYISDSFLNNGLLLPINLNVEGKFSADKMYVNKELDSLEKRLLEKQKEEFKTKNDINNLLQQNINAYYFFKRFPSQINNPPSIPITKELRDGSSFYFGMEKKFGGGTFCHIQNFRELNRPNNPYYPGKPGERLYNLDLHGWRNEGTCNGSTPRTQFNWTNAININWNDWFFMWRGSIYGPFVFTDVKFCAGQGPIHKFTDFSRKKWN